MKIEAATKQDAKSLAHLINIAGEGMPFYMWSGMVEGQQTPLQVGEQRAAREAGGFSYRNARVIRIQGEVAGMIVSYPLADPYPQDNLESYPAVVRPLVILESKVPGSWYVNALATLEKYRGRGVASQLMQEAEAKARQQGVERMSIIVASENTTAKGLYLSLGYELVTSLPVVPYPNAIYGGVWELLVKPLPAR